MLLKLAQTKTTTGHSQICRLLTLSCTRQDLQPTKPAVTLERFLEEFKILDAIKGCSRQNHELCIQIMKKLMNMIEQLKALVIFLSSFNVKVELLGQCNLFVTVCTVQILTPPPPAKNYAIKNLGGRLQCGI